MKGELFREDLAHRHSTRAPSARAPSQHCEEDGWVFAIGEGVMVGVKMSPSIIQAAPWYEGITVRIPSLL